MAAPPPNPDLRACPDAASGGVRAWAPRIAALAVVLAFGAALASPDARPRLIALLQEPTATLSPSPGPASTRTPTASPSATPSPEPSATPTSTLTPSPTAQPRGQPTLGYYFSTPVPPPPTEIPPPVGRIALPDGVVNILLIGIDRLSDNSYRTDTMVVMSINKNTGSVTLISIPRDLYVFIPQWTMQRINTAYTHGNSVGYPGGGASLLIQTILYNLGLPIHYHVRVDFAGFKQIVDTLGGIDVPVWCELEDYVLDVPPDYESMSPEQRDQYTHDPAHWDAYVVPVGVQRMDGEDALLYARLRQSYRAYVRLPAPRRAVSDYDRARRQQQVLRAIYRQGLRLDMVPRIPELYAQYRSVVDTDLDLGDVLQFVPVAGTLDSPHVRSVFIGPGQVTAWTTPVDRANVLLPKPAEIRALLENAMRPPSEKSLARGAARVEVWNGTANADWGMLAVDRLGWEGFNAVEAPADRTDYAHTTIIDFSSSTKGSSLDELAALLRVAPENRLSQPDPNSPIDYRIILGADYDTCGAPLASAQPTATPTAAPTALSSETPTVTA